MDDAPNGPTPSELGERSEAGAYAALVGAAPHAWRDANGVAIEDAGGGVALFSGVARSSMVFNRVLGLGWTQPLTAALLASIEQRYRARGVGHFVVEVSKAAACGDPVPVLRAASYLRLHSSAVLHRGADPLPAPDCGLRVRRAGAADASAVATLACAVFGLPDAYGPLFESSVSEGRARHWLAFDGPVPVASAMTVPSLPGCDWIGWVGTLPSHRRRGAQAALTVAQLNECHALGTRTVTLEVGTGSGPEATASLRNYQRLGWEVAHERITFLKRMRT
jgi:GNAT superfamily N-acetyltransferase